MKSSFFEFNVARTALHTARMGISVTNHNMANSATPGYSRQITQVRAGIPMNFRNGRGLIGTGSDVYGVTQIRDLYLDRKYRTESSVLGEYSVKQGQLNAIENIFNSMSDMGLNDIMDGLFASLQELSQASGDLTLRTNMLRTADTLIDRVNSLAKNLKHQQTDINMDIHATIQVMNGLGEQIRNINDQIQILEMDGSQANDLRDARANLVDELSKYINIEAKEVVRNEKIGIKEFVVLINGNTYIDNLDINPLTVEKRSEKLNPMDAPDLYDIYFTNTHAKLDMYHANLKGELKGLIDTRDGNNGDYFTKTATSTITYTAATMSLRITDPTRVDLDSPGNISIKDPVTGLTREFKYNSFTLNNDGSTTFELDKALPANMTNAYLNNATITAGKSVSYKGIPHYMDKLNTMVRTLAKAFNEGIAHDETQLLGITGHIFGYDLDGEQGNLLFDFEGITAADRKPNGGIVNYNLINCENFRISADIAGAPRKIAAAAMQHMGADESDNELLLGLLTLATSKNVFAEGRITDFIIGISGELGIDLKQAENFTLNYTDVTTTIDIQRRSISGVDLNEESINMVKYNQMYQAAATLINIIDNIYDITINRLGNF